MLDILIQRRKEYVDEAARLTAERAARIESEVARYRQSLEESYSVDEIDKIQNIVAAMDAVIAFEATKAPVETPAIVEPIHAETVNVEVTPGQDCSISYNIVSDCDPIRRPGMPDIFTPDRG